MWKTPADSMSIHDDSSTVLSVRASDAGLAADQAEKHDGTALPNFYGKSYCPHSILLVSRLELLTAAAPTPTPQSSPLMSASPKPATASTLLSSP